MTKLSRLRPWAVARFLAFVLVASAAIYGAYQGGQADKKICSDVTTLRDDLTFVLQGAGENERAQLTVINRVATPNERDTLAKTFEPGLAAALDRISKKTC